MSYEDMDNETRRLARRLTDDREDPDLFVFEKTWGHRLLAGVSVGMLISAFVIVAYCAYRLADLLALGVPDVTATFGFMLYTVGIVAGVVVVPPALLGIYTAKHPGMVVAAIAAPVVAIAVLACLAAYALTVPGAQPFTVVLYALVGAVFPVFYLAAALKIRKSSF